MSGSDDPSEFPSAPGTPPGADVFAESGSRRTAPRRPEGFRAEPTGIVRLSDLIASGTKPPGVGEARERSRAGGQVPREGSAPTASAAPTGSHRVRAKAGRNRPLLADPPAPIADGDAPRRRSSAAGLSHDRSRQAPSIDGLPEPAPALAGDASPDEGPAYEPLFGGPGEPRRRARPVRPPPTATQRALGLLTRREHSRKELTRKLVARGVEVAEVEAAVEKLAGAGWQDDGRFAESLVRARASAGYGPLHIRAELATHDLSAEARAAALEAFEGDWAAIARELVTRRFARIEDPRLRERKAADFLLRRGFPSETARSAARFDPAGS